MKNCLMVFLMMFGINAFAEVHRWVDENNRVHYSDLPPSVDAKTKKLRSASDTGDAAETGAAASTPAAPKTIAEREAELRMARQTKKEAADKAAQEQNKKDAKQEYCTQARLSLNALQQDVRIMEIDANGERSYLEDEQRQQRIAKAQQDISKHCK
jgi:hypothetical protein